MFYLYYISLISHSPVFGSSTINTFKTLLWGGGTAAERESTDLTRQA